jgi:predicted SAM-dependent methyltransferase
MIGRFLKGVLNGGTRGQPMRLHIGGLEVREGWRILNAQPGPAVDYVGDCTDLSRFPDASVEAIYASHVLEHLGYQRDLPRALREFRRVLMPGGVAMIAVPDLENLCRLFLDPRVDPGQERFEVMRMMFGGQLDEFDFHRVGLTFEFLGSFLRQAGFSSVERVDDFGLFADASVFECAGVRTSLNVVARR